MKKLIGFFALILLLAGCKTSQVSVPVEPESYVQLYETQGVNISAKNNYYIYENDSIKIIYDFWSDKGKIRFSVYNKTNKPLYINWLKSTCILNSSSTAYASGTTATACDQPKIGFIPPKAYISKIGPDMTARHFSDWGTDYTKSTEPRHDNAKITTSISSKQFTKENSPITFRNYLSFSFWDDLSSEFVVDNECFVKKISVMDTRHFWDGSTQASQGTTRFEKPSDFYIKVR